MQTSLHLGKRCRIWLLLFLAMMSLGAAAERSVYSQISNKELKQRTLGLVKNIRDIVESYNQKDRELMTDYDKKDQPEYRSDERKNMRQQWIRQSDAVHDATMRRYKENYWADAILLLDELYRRVPQRMRQKGMLPIYQHPTNVLGMETIANHLELLAKALPDA
ncbi:MAG: hypothetical protein E6J73_22200 [Deltaproteobacteria bacterium]|jgi:hypothetical protein|nr:MAG: hypothetical protein E6J73_22200 [Deltaproteobacteria bacterium]